MASRKMVASRPGAPEEWERILRLHLRRGLVSSLERMKNLVPAHRSLVLLGALLGGIVSSAFAGDHGRSWVILLIGYVVLGLGGAYLLGASRRWCLAVSILAVAMIVLESLVLSGSQQMSGMKVAALGCGMGLLGLLLYVVIDYSLLGDAVRKADRILAGICGYLLIAMFWSNLFHLIEILSPDSFSDPNGGELTRIDFLYFSLTSLTTLGYGDVLPVTDPARISSVLESVFGVLYLAVFISALVAGPGGKRR